MDQRNGHQDVEAVEMTANDEGEVSIKLVTRGSRDGIRKSHPLCCSTRMTLTFVLFLGFVLLYGLRINLSVAMVCMVNHSAVATTEKAMESSNSTLRASNVGKISNCGLVQNQTIDLTQDGSMMWSKKLQGLALSSFFWGYMVTQIPAGWLASRYGAKMLILMSIGGGSIVTLMMPTAANSHFAFFVGLRVILGILQGMIFPAAHVIWTHWAPPMEKSRLIGFSYAGAQIGNVVALPLSGALCAYGFAGGWPSIFYVFGIMGLAWSVLWLLFGASSPSEHRCISNRERDFIEMALDGQLSKKHPAIPWLRIFTSLPMWAIIIANISGDFGAYVFLTNLPTYMKENLGFGAELSGLVATLPYIGFWAMMNITATIADALIERKVCSVTVVRKFFNTFGLLASGSALLILSNLGCQTSTTVSIFLLTLGVSFCGSYYGAGFLVNHCDIAPQFAGILMGICNTFGTMSGMVAPALIGVMTQNGTSEEWRNVFYVTAGVMGFGALFYLIFASGELQSWAKEKDSQIVEIFDSDNPSKDV